MISRGRRIANHAPIFISNVACARRPQTTHSIHTTHFLPLPIDTQMHQCAHFKRVARFVDSLGARFACCVQIDGGRHATHKDYNGNDRHQQNGRRGGYMLGCYWQTRGHCTTPSHHQSRNACANNALYLMFVRGTQSRAACASHTTARIYVKMAQ